MSKSKRFLSLLLALCLLFGLTPGITVAEAADDRIQWRKTGESSVLPGEGARKDIPSLMSMGYSDEDVVRVSIILSEPSALEKYYVSGTQAKTIAAGEAAILYRGSLENKQEQVANAISKKVLNGNALDVVWNLTLITNAISANVRFGDIEAIKRVDGVSDVYVEPVFMAISTPDDGTADPSMATSSEQIGSAPAYEEGLYGAGMRIAVIDTGTNPRHQSFDGSALEYALRETYGPDFAKTLDLLDASEIAEKFDLLHITSAPGANVTAQSLYGSTKMPFNYNYVDGDTDVSHDNDKQGAHGSHVAGIAAANRYIVKDGGFVDASESVLVQGVAPDAQILTMKVFGKSGGAYASDQFAAIEDAIVLGADVINMSIGTYYAGMTYGETQYQAVLDRLKSTDTILTTSAGNYGSFVDLGASNDKLYIDDVSMNTVGNPGAYRNGLTVASAENRGLTGSYFTANDGSEKIFYLEGSGDDTVDLVGGETYDYVYIDSVGVVQTYDASYETLGNLLENQLDKLNGEYSLEDKVVVMNRGMSPFFAKANEAFKLGAKAVIIVNNAPGTVGADLKGYEGNVPVFTITMDNGSLLRVGEAKTVTTNYDKDGNYKWGSEISYYTGTVTVSSGPDAYIPDGAKDIMSDYSAWGIPGDLSLKPEITAPGGNIYSVNGNTSDGYTTMSGTSMSAPQLAGMAALVIQHIEKEDLADSSSLSARQLAQSLLMSTAVPMMESDGLYYPVLRQGAGLANVGYAVTSPSFITVEGQDDGKVKAELGDDVDRDGTYTVKFKIHNMTGSQIVYTVSADVFTQAVVTENGESFMGTKTAKLTADVEVNGSYGSAKVTLPGSGSVDVTVTFSLTDGQKAVLDKDYPNGAYIEAFITAKPQSSDDGALGVTHSIPVVGFYGGWTESSMFDHGEFVKNYVFGQPSHTPYAGVYSNSLMVRHDGDIYDYYIGYPYGDSIEYLEDRNAFDPENSKVSVFSFTPLRNFLNSRYTISNAETGEIYAQEEQGPGYATFYHEDYETWVYSDQSAAINWRGTDANGDPLPDGTKVKVELTLAPEFYRVGSGEDVDWDALGDGASISSVITVDYTAPEVIDIDDTTIDDGYITVKVADNEYVGLVALYSPAAVTEQEALAYVTPSQMEPGQPIEVEVRLDNENAAVGETFILQVGDYAGHISEYTLKMDLTAKVRSYYNFFAQADRYWYGYNEDASAGGMIGGYGVQYDGFESEDAPTVAAAAYADGYVFFADGLGDFYVAQYGDFTNAKYIGSYQLELEDVPGVDCNPRSMTYNPEDGLLYITFRAFNDLFWGDGPDCFRSMELVTLDPETCEFNYVGRLGYEEDEDMDEFEIIHGVEAQAVAVDDEGNFYGVNMPYLDAIDTWDTYVGLYRWTADTIDKPEFLCELKDDTNPDGSYDIAWDSEKDCLVLANTVNEFVPIPGSDWETDDYTYCDIYTIDVKSGDYTPNQIIHAQLENPYQSIAGLFVTPDSVSYDFNGDGAVNTGDAQALLDYVTGKRTSIVKTAYSDINGDGKCDTYDVEELLHMELGSQRFAPTNEITRVVIDRTEAEVTMGGRLQLDAYADPWFAADRGVVWSSSDTSVATVDEEGLVNAREVGTVTITASAKLDASVKAVCTVIVNPAKYDINGAMMDGDENAKWFSLNTEVGKVVPGSLLEGNIDIVSGTEDFSDEGSEKIYFQDSEGYMYEYDAEKNLLNKSSGQTVYRMTDMTVLEEATRRTGSTKIVGISGAMIFYGVNGPLTDDFSGGWASMAAVLPTYGANALVGVGYAGYFYEGTTLYEVLYALDDVGNFWLLYFDFTDPSNPQFESVAAFETTMPHDVLLPDEITGVYYDSLVVSDVDTILFSRYNGEKTEIYLLEQAGFFDDGTFTVTSFTAAKVSEMEKDQWPAILLEANYTGSTSSGDDWEDDDWGDDWDDEYGYDGGIDLAAIAGKAQHVGEGMSVCGISAVYGQEHSVSSGSAKSAKSAAAEAAENVGQKSLDIKSAEADTVEVEVEDAEFVVKLDHLTHNGMLRLTYDTDEVTLVSAGSALGINSINDRSGGTLVFGWACEDDPFESEETMLELVFRRTSASVTASDIKLEVVEDSDVSKLPQASVSRLEFVYTETNPGGTTNPGETTNPADTTTPDTDKGHVDVPPETGDESRVAVWLVIAVIGACGIVAVCVPSKKRLRREK